MNMNNANELFKKIQDKNLSIEVYNELASFILNFPNEILNFAKLCLSKLNNGGTFFDYCLRHLPFEDFEEIIAITAEMIRNGQGNELTGL